MNDCFDNMNWIIILTVALSITSIIYYLMQISYLISKRIKAKKILLESFNVELQYFYSELEGFILWGKNKDKIPLSVIGLKDIAVKLPKKYQKKFKRILIEAKYGNTIPAFFDFSIDNVKCLKDNIEVYQYYIFRKIYKSVFSDIKFPAM